MESLRIRLIEQMCRMAEADLPRVEAFLRTLGNASSVEMEPPSKSASVPHRDWPHAPIHRLSEHGTFLITAATNNKEHFFRDEASLTFLETELLRLAKQYEVLLEAWAVFSNHYHFIAHVLGGENRIGSLVSQLHSNTATEINGRDGAIERAVWFQYWDTQLTFEKSYLARLNYVHQNAVKHGLVQLANQFRWCSAAWFERTATPAQVKTIYSFKFDRLKIDDDYDPVL